MIDRSRVKALKGRTPPAEMVVRNTTDLARACRACRTAGELAGMWDRVFRHMGRHGYVDASPGRKCLGLIPLYHGVIGAEEERLFDRIEGVVVEATDMPADTPLDEQFWMDAGLWP